MTAFRQPKLTVYRERAAKAFEALGKLGCGVYTDAFGLERCYFDHTPAIRLNAGQTAEFARLIRVVSNLEKTGAVVPDIDRMGNMIGWHLCPKCV